VQQSFVLGIYMKICRENPNFVQTGPKDRGLYMDTSVCFIVAGDKFATILFYSALSIFGGTQWRSLLRHCSTSWKVAGSIPDDVIGFFH
jgi:hypothetical protein